MLVTEWVVKKPHETSSQAPWWKHPLNGQLEGIFIKIYNGDVEKIRVDWNYSLSPFEEINKKSTAQKLVSKAESPSKQSARDISEYATNTPADTIAEALMDVYLHGDNAMKISNILKCCIPKLFPP